MMFISNMKNSLVYKKWMRYKKYLLSGQWHIHTNYTDGENSVDEYCKRAVELRIPLIAFTEHVRRELTYNYQDLVDEIRAARKNYSGLKIITGCEAKVLEDGNLDVSEDVIKQCEIVLMAFHSFPISKDKYVNALKTALSNPRVDIWAHPGLYLRNKTVSLRDEEVENIFSIANKNNVLIELNKKYDLPLKSWIKIGEKKEIIFVRGGDIHSVNDFK
jgi:DNA polymerase (family 10)/putative hydrolase